MTRDDLINLVHKHFPAVTLEAIERLADAIHAALPVTEDGADD